MHTSILVFFLYPTVYKSTII